MSLSVSTVLRWYSFGPERGQRFFLSLLLGSDLGDLGLEAAVGWRAMMTCLQPHPAPFKAASSLCLRLGFSHLLSKPLAAHFLPMVCLQPIRNPRGHTVSCWLAVGTAEELVPKGAGTQVLASACVPWPSCPVFSTLSVPIAAWVAPAVVREARHSADYARSACLESERPHGAQGGGS